MFSSTYRQPLSFALAALGLGLAGAPGSAHATADVLIAVQTCTLAGPDPSQAAAQAQPAFVWINRDCGINPPGGDRIPTWKTLALTATDANRSGGSVVATLNCRSRATAALSTVATVHSAATVRNVPHTSMGKIAGPLNFDLCAYFIRVSAPLGAAGTEALMVVLGQ